jgi:hypothetical protein
MSLLPEGRWFLALRDGNYLEILAVIDRANGFVHVDSLPRCDRELPIVSGSGQHENATTI